MPRIIDHVRFRQNLIEATVESVCVNGFERATSKSIAQICNVNEANIFRYFIDLKDLYRKTFAFARDECLKSVEFLFESLKDVEITEDVKKHFIEEVSESIEQHKKHVIYFLRYYYSAEFDEKQCEELKQKCRDALLKAKLSEEACDKCADCMTESLIVIFSYVFMQEKRVMTDGERETETIANIFLSLFREIYNI